jgi:hypothetical protein
VERLVVRVPALRRHWAGGVSMLAAVAVAQLLGISRSKVYRESENVWTS